MKRISAACVLAVLMLILTACQKQEEQAQSPNVLIPAIMYDGNVYCSTFHQIPAEVDKSAIVGFVDSIVPISQWPEEEGQANFEILYAPYALTDDGLLVLVDSQWTLFEVPGEETTAPSEILSEVTEAYPAAPEQWISQEQAMINGFVVIQDGDVRHNQTEWMQYMAAVEKKEPASVTVMQYFRSEEGFRQSRFDLVHDGELHHLTRMENGEITEETYTTLLLQQERLGEDWEPFDSVIRFCLANGEDSKVLFEDLIAEPDWEGVTEVDFHLKEGEPALAVYAGTERVNAVISLLEHGEYLFGDPEEYYYGAKLLMTNGHGEQLVIELDLNKGNFRYGMQTYCYGEVSDLLNLLGLDKWPEEVYAEHGPYIN